MSVVKLSGYGQFNSQNFWTGLKQFAARGGLYNGLNPSIVGRIWYVNANSETDASEHKGPVGSDSNSGLSPLTPFATIARALEFIDCYDVIVLDGVFREQVVAPIGPYDITIIGSCNDPRQATDAGLPTGGGASWLAPTSPEATTPLIRVISQSWRFINLQMAPVAGAACITFDRRETAAIPDSSHGSVLGCYFSTGGASGYGVELIEVKKIRIEDCLFEALTGASGTAIKGTAGAGVAAKNHLSIKNNVFVQNINDINIPSTDFSEISFNTFFSTNPIEGGIRIKLNGSTGRNYVHDNNFFDVIADVLISKGYTAAAGDVWRNWAAGSTVPIATVPTA